jgi:hypothetical protein
MIARVIVPGRDGARAFVFLGGRKETIPMNRYLIMAGAVMLAAVLTAPARAQEANYPLPAEPTAQSGSTYYYAVPLGYTWDMFAYVPNYGDWNTAIGDHGLDAGQIPGNPTFCGASGNTCPSTAGGPMSTAFITVNDDPTHGFSGIPLLIGPTQDGFNNVLVGFGQAIPVVPGHYTALYLAYAQVNGPQTKLLALNYADGAVASSVTWADWNVPKQAKSDFFTWKTTHRLSPAGSSPHFDTSTPCALITKYVPVDPSRTLTSVTLGTDGNWSGGLLRPGDTITSNGTWLPFEPPSAGRLALGAVTLASTDATLGGYGFVSGHLKDPTGRTLATPAHDSTAQPGYDVFVPSPALGNYGAGANEDGSYTLGLPAGTYVLSAAVRGGGDHSISVGPQATPVTVTVAAGQTTTQDITINAKPDPGLWGELKGTVKDANGKPVAGATPLFSESANGPFAAIGLSQDTGSANGTTASDGTYDVVGLYAGQAIYVEAVGSLVASTVPVKVTLKPGGVVTQDLTVAALQ